MPVCLAGILILIFVYLALWPMQMLTHTPVTGYPLNGDISVQMLENGDSIVFGFSSDSTRLRRIDIYPIIDPENNEGFVCVEISDRDSVVICSEKLALSELNNADWNGAEVGTVLKRGRQYTLTIRMEGNGVIWIGVLP